MLSVTITSSPASSTKYWEWIFKWYYQSKMSTRLYDLTTNSWRVLCVVIGFYHNIVVASLWRENTYWFATQAQSPHSNFLLSFDFSAKRFYNLSLPQPFPFNISALSVFKDEQLSVSKKKKKRWAALSVRQFLQWRYFTCTGETLVLDRSCHGARS